MNYHPNTCKCGCGGQIEVKEHHRWVGVPLYIHGHNKGNMGKIHSEEYKQRMREAKKEFYLNGGVIWNKGKKLTKEHAEKVRIANLGKKRSEEAKQKTSETLKENYRTGKIIPYWKDKKHTEEYRARHSEIMVEKGINVGGNNPMFGKYGELAPNWQGGLSFLPYPPEFNKKLKQAIKDRDFHICQTPGCMNTENLCIHHIDYNKKNNNSENLTTLCNSCHSKTNYNREYWTKYYQEILNVYL